MNYLFDSYLKIEQQWIFELLWITVSVTLLSVNMILSIRYEAT